MKAENTTFISRANKPRSKPSLSEPLITPKSEQPNSERKNQRGERICEFATNHLQLQVDRILPKHPKCLTVICAGEAQQLHFSIHAHERNSKTHAWLSRPSLSQDGDKRNHTPSERRHHSPSDPSSSLVTFSSSLPLCCRPVSHPPTRAHTHRGVTCNITQCSCQWANCAKVDECESSLCRSDLWSHARGAISAADPCTSTLPDKWNLINHRGRKAQVVPIPASLWSAGARVWSARRSALKWSCWKASRSPHRLGFWKTGKRKSYH